MASLFDRVEQAFRVFPSEMEDNLEGLEELSREDQENVLDGLEALREDFRQFYDDLAFKTGNITKF